MAMLAGPRRKQKVINLRAKNNAWSNDSSKFGQRMLEKMGWSSGKGLGAKENGIVEHVVARYKNDEKGLGFEDKNDQWTKHEDDFNALLANLSNSEGTEEKLHSGVSLEVKSKKSKARVHYHKFTRGKDLTRYSAKDLANIFGKKSLTEEEQAPQELIDKSDVKTTEQVFTEKGSMEDYFKSKLAKFKSNNTYSFPKNELEDNAEYVFQGFARENDDSNDNNLQDHQGLGFSFYNSSSNKEIENGSCDKTEEVLQSTEESIKIKKKKKKNKKKENDSESINCEIEPENTEVLDGTVKKSKKKKFIEEPVQYEQPSEDLQPKKKKSKANKTREPSCPQESIDTQNIEEESYVPKKKKKRKNKDLD